MDAGCTYLLISKLVLFLREITAFANIIIGHIFITKLRELAHSWNIYANSDNTVLKTLFILKNKTKKQTKMRYCIALQINVKNS